MQKTIDYQAHAEDCRKMASSTMVSERHKAMLLQMAETWETLARDRQEHLQRRERIAAIDAA